MLRSISVFSASIVLMLSACGPSGEDTTFGIDRSGSPIISGERDSKAEGLSEGTEVGDEAGSKGDTALSTAAQTYAGTSTDAPESLVGSWTSPFCAHRSYARKIQFDEAGKFVAQDLVSPCPPDVVCFWSGILNHRGSYEVVENTIKLDLSEPRTNSAMPFPEELVINRTTGGPAELAPSGDFCNYVRDAEPITPARTPAIPTL